MDENAYVAEQHLSQAERHVAEALKKIAHLPEYRAHLDELRRARWLVNRFRLRVAETVAA